MRTTINIDDKLMQRAMEVTGATRKTDLIRQALEALVQREAAANLVRLGGTMPGIAKVFYESLDEPRRRR